VRSACGGNHDSAALDLELAEWFNPDARRAIEWTAGQITPATRDWLARLPERLEIEGITLVHAVRGDPTWEYITTPSGARANLGAFATAHLLFGHTHFGGAFRDNDGRMEAIEPSDGSTFGPRCPARPREPRQRRPAAGRRFARERGDPGHLVLDADVAPSGLRDRRHPGGIRARGLPGAGGSPGRPDASVIGGRRPLQGRKIGDRRVRVDRPHSPYFRYTDSRHAHRQGGGHRTAHRVRAGLVNARRALFGRPLANEEEAEERLAKKAGPADLQLRRHLVLRYATEEILRILVVAGAAALALSIEVAMAISLLLAVVSISYRQVCRAYPSGGGAYVVARENLSQTAGWWRRQRCSSTMS